MIDLEFVDGQSFDLLEGRVTGTKVIDRYLDTEVAHAFKQNDSVGHILHKRILGDFKHQMPCVDRIVLKNLADEIRQVLIGQIIAGHIDRHGQVDSVIQPGPTLLDSVTQYPLGYQRNVPRLLGNLNEIARWNHAESRMLPSQECFDAVHPAVIQGQFRLKEQAEFVLSCRAPHVANDFKLPYIALLPAMLVHANVALRQLRFVFCNRRTAQKLVRVGCVIRVDANTNACAECDPNRIDRQAAAEQQEQMFGGMHGGVETGGFQHDGKLISLEPCE